VDNDNDGYEDPEPGPVPNPEPGPVPEPGPMPSPEPGSRPDPGQAPTPDPAQVPVVVTVSIIGSFGTEAFMPNPVQASIGNTIVWTNGDVRAHDIVLGDGTVVGNLAPGQSSLPIPLTSPTASYQCTIHPSMVGHVTDPAAAPSPVPPDQSQNPMPDPSPSPAPPTDPYYLR
jgi:plastocyanin